MLKHDICLMYVSVSDNKLTEQPNTLTQYVPDSVADTIDHVAAGHVPYTGM